MPDITNRTIDEMLAELRGDYHINMASIDDGYSVSLRFSGAQEVDTYTGPTLRAALAAAVLAVGA